MCPGYERSQSLKPRRSSAASSPSSWAPDHIPYSSLADFSDQDDNEEEDEASEVLNRGRSLHNRLASSYYFDRQMYLHSYTFSRKTSVCDRLRGGMRRLKAAAWAVIACNHNHHHHHHKSVRKFGDFNGDSSSGKSSSSKIKRFRMPSSLLCSFSFKPRCIRVPA